MQRSSAQFLRAAALLCLFGIVFATAAQEVDDQLTANKRLFRGIGPGLRSLRRGADGKYYILATPNVGLAVFDAVGKQLTVIGAPPPEPVANKAGRSAIAFGEDCDVDSKGNIYIADRGYNLINVFTPDGKILRSIPVNAPISILALPDGEVAVSTFQAAHLITVYNAAGHLVREFGDPEDLSTRPELNRYLSQGRLASDSQARIYYGYTYLPEPRVRQYDRFGYGGTDFEFTGLGAWSEGRAARREIDRQGKRVEPPNLHPILTAFGVDPVNGDVWMCLHNTLLHFDKDGNRRSEYQIYTSDNSRLEATVILVEEDRLLIGSDPLGIFEFRRPDRNH
jgi:hypothetical protein